MLIGVNDGIMYGPTRHLWWPLTWPLFVFDSVFGRFTPVVKLALYTKAAFLRHCVVTELMAISQRNRHKIVLPFDAAREDGEAKFFVGVFPGMN